jgi:hypothetical protein
LLDIPISSLNHRVGLCLGSRTEVERFAEIVCHAPLHAPPLLSGQSLAKQSNL